MRCQKTGSCKGTRKIVFSGTTNYFKTATPFFFNSSTASSICIVVQSSDGVLVILATHLVTISGIAHEGVSSGEGVLLKLNRDAPYEIVGRLNFGR
ncbi:MAG: hypothetical protein WBM69_14165 [Desulfobacterales bacterium]